jgi:hypothetical protein
MAEYHDIRGGKIYLYSFIYMEYVDAALSYGQNRIRERCEYFKGRFNIADWCHGHRGQYITSE